MKKAFRNKLCAYCGLAECQSDEHIFCKKFFLIRDRGNLPKAPACKKCNGEKAALEDYALCVLPFASQHPNALEILKTLVPPRLYHGPKHKLRQSLRDGQSKIWVEEQPKGLIYPNMTMPLESEKIKSLVQYIVRGLVWFHWHSYLADPSLVQVFSFTASGERIYKEVMQAYLQAGAKKDRVVEDLKDGMFRYEAIKIPALDEYPSPYKQIPFKEGMTLWRIQMLGGTAFADSDASLGISASFSAITGPVRPAVRKAS